MYRKLSFTVICLLITVICCATPWDGVTLTAVVESDNTFEVSEASELAWIASQSQTNNFAGKLIKLTADIDINEGTHTVGTDVLHTDWTPIGSNTTPFAGTFDGNGHVVRNIRINNTTTLPPLGLFGKVSADGVVKNVAVSRGQIGFTTSISNIGGIVGVNEGTITHCFNMMNIVSHGSNIGGIVGDNRGTITYCYNTGILESASNMGGIVGINSGTVSNSYNIGYCVDGSNVGAIYGVNSGSVTNTFYDEQMCRRGNDFNQSGVINKTQSSDMFNIFETDDEWVTSEDKYPELQVFSGTNASLASVVVAELDFSKHDVAGEVKNDFVLYENAGNTWVLPHYDIIIKTKSGTKYTLLLPCGEQRENAECWKGEDCKYVYLKIVGYKPFDVGVVGTGNQPTAYVCINKDLKFSDSKAAAEGKDDEPDEDKYPYYYKIERFFPTIVDYESGIVDTTFSTLVKDENFGINGEVEIVSKANFDNYKLPTDSGGIFLYRRWSHDSKCQENYQLAKGYFIVQVYDEVQSGKIDEVKEVYYGVPVTINIANVEEATGGNGPYFYQWRETKFSVNYETGDTTIIYHDRIVNDENGNAVDSVGLTVTLTESGEYVYYRRAQDSFCDKKDEWHPSIVDKSTTNLKYIESQKRIVIFDVFSAGRIESGEYNYCDPAEATITIKEDTVCAGGDGRYLYRWLCNGVLVDGAEDKELNLSTMTFNYAQEYTFVRQTKDQSGYADWVQSEGSVKINIYKSHDAGSIVSEEKGKVCLDNGETIDITVRQQSIAVGEGTITYQWKIGYLKNGTDTTVLADIGETTNALSSWTLDPSKYNVSYPVTFIIQRYVKDELCMKNGEKSRGAFSVTIGKNAKSSQTFSLCKNELPYSGSYTMQDGSIKTYTFTADGEVVVINDQTPDGCKKEVTYSCKVKPQPVVKVDPIGSLCTGQDKLRLSYNVVSGDVTDCYVTFDEKLWDVDDYFKTQKTITVPDVFEVPDVYLNKVPVGEYNIYIQYENKSEDGCLSDINTISFSVSIGGFVYQLFDDVLVVDNYGNSFTSYQWYKNGELVEGATDQYYLEENGSIDGVYSVALIDENGNSFKTCDETFPRIEDHLQNIGAVGVKVYPNPIRGGERLSVVSLEDARVSIYTLDGRVVLTEDIVKGYNSLNIPHVEGVYIMKVLNSKKQEGTIKLIVK